MLSFNMSNFHTVVDDQLLTMDRAMPLVEILLTILCN